MRHGRVCQADPAKLADEQFGDCVGAGEFGGGGGAVFDGVGGAGGGDLGVASDLHWAVCGDGGVLGWVAAGGEEEGLREKEKRGVVSGCLWVRWIDARGGIGSLGIDDAFLRMEL